MPATLQAIGLLVLMTQPLRLDFAGAGCCMLGAVYFMFRGQQ